MQETLDLELCYVLKQFMRKTKIGKGIKMLLMKRSFDRVFVEEIRQV